MDWSRSGRQVAAAALQPRCGRNALFAGLRGPTRWRWLVGALAVALGLVGLCAVGIALVGGAHVRSKPP